MKQHLPLAAVACSSLLVSAVNGAMAQTNPAATKEDRPWVLEEVVVTAQKRVEDFTDVALSVSVVTGETLAASGINSTAELGQVVPGLMFSRLGSYAVPTIRGITSNAVLNEANIATVIDGVYMPATSSLLTQLNNVAAVEVLKGPQGTLFGRNATGGVINIVTKTPSHETGGELELGAGQFNEVTGNLYATTGLSEKVAIDIAANYIKNDGYINNVTTGNDAGTVDDTAVRSKLRVDFSDALAMDLTAFYTRGRGNGTSTSKPVGLLSNFYGQPGVTILPGEEFKIANDWDQQIDTKTYGGSAKIDFDSGNYSWRSISSYRDDSIDQYTDSDRTNLPIRLGVNGVWQNTFTQEFNVLSNYDGPVNFTSGLYYYKSHMKLPVNVYSSYTQLPPVPPSGYASRGQQDIDSYSAFGEVTWQATDRLTLLGGLRYTIEDRKAHVQLRIGEDMPPAGEADDTWKDPSWRASASYALTDNTNLYATYGRGFKSGGFNISSSPPAKSDAETLDAYEIGFKTEGDRMRLSGAIYYMTYENLQIQSYDAVTSSTFQQSAETETGGAELDLTYALTEGLTVSAGVNWMPLAEYKDFTDADIFVPNTELGYGVTRLLPAPDLSGTDSLRSPEWQGFVNLNYSRELFRGTLNSTANVSYLGDFYWLPGEQDVQQQDAYALVNFSASWLSPNADYQLKMYVKNATDKKYNMSFSGNTTEMITFWAPPRNFGGSVTFYF